MKREIKEENRTYCHKCGAVCDKSWNYCTQCGMALMKSRHSAEEKEGGVTPTAAK